MNKDFIEKSFLEKFPNVNKHYLKRYIKIVSSNKEYIGSLEKHHILPKSIWPEYKTTKSNYKYLSLKAHFLVHWILVKMLPNSEEMTYAFYYMCNRNENKNKSIKDFHSMRTKVLLRLKKINDDRLKAGTHNFQGANNPNYKKVANGTHPWLKKNSCVYKRVADGSLSKQSRESNLKRVRGNTHNFQGIRNPVHKRIKEGKHPSWNDEFKKIISDMNKKRVEDGVHSFVGAKPWNHYGSTSVTINTWKRADIVKRISEENPTFRYKKLLAHMRANYESEEFSLSSMKRMVKWFDEGWSPEKDEKWLQFFKKPIDIE